MCISLGVAAWPNPVVSCEDFLVLRFVFYLNFFNIFKRNVELSLGFGQFY